MKGKKEGRNLIRVPRPPEAAGELGEGGLQVDEADPLIDGEPLELHEGGVCVAS